MPYNAIPIQASHSILNPSDLFQKIVPEYSLKDSSSCVFWWGGQNHTYRIKAADGDYALRVYVKDWRSLDEIEYEVDALLHLQKKGFPVAAPIAKKDGTYISHIDAPEGTRYVIITKYMKGGPVDLGQSDNAYRLGQSIAQFHAATDDFNSSHAARKLDAENLIQQPLNRVLPHIAHNPTDTEFLKEHAATVIKIINAAADEMDVGLCHGDFFGPNMFDYEGTISMFDFDFCGHGFRAYDLASLKAGMQFRLNQMEHWPSVLEGYRSVRSFSETDEHMTNVLLAAFLFNQNRTGVEQCEFGYVGMGFLGDFTIKTAMEQHRKLAAMLQGGS